MFTLLVILHLLAAAILILVVLLQSGKAGDLASTFGGATSQTAFGARGAATMLTKMTTICAIMFMCTSLGLAIFYSRDSGSSVMEDVQGTGGVTEQAPSESPAPAATETPQEDSPEDPAAPPGEEQ